MVSNRWDRDWHTFLACERRYIVIMLDGRGTGFRGRPLRNHVMDDLGHWEVADQIAAAREMVKRKYVDRNRIGIWGWVNYDIIGADDQSYGGYMTCKTLEADSGLFTLGSEWTCAPLALADLFSVAVAPGETDSAEVRKALTGLK